MYQENSLTIEGGDLNHAKMAAHTELVDKIDGRGNGVDTWIVDA